MLAALQLVELEEYGGKALELGRAWRAGLPVPPGWALAPELVEQVARGEAVARVRVKDAFAKLAAPAAVRSSAIGEDGATASFAGQHATVLNVRSGEAVIEAIVTVYESARSPAALAYRRRLGLAGEPRMAVVLQQLVLSECAGIMFTKNPVTQADERVIEASWGLGEVVVAGLVTPDRYRMARGGRILERSPGEKDIAVRWSAAGGTEEVRVEPERVFSPCLDDARLKALEGLAGAVESASPGAHDIEWAFAGGALYLLQRRAVTRG